MGEPSIRELEHDVETARSKLARDLSTLRSPDTYSKFTDTLKNEAMSAKDTLIDKAKTSMQATIESFVEDLKAKAAANPTAVLAIGAGIAWRLIQRPPIATALVGAGLISLLRTNASHTYGRTTSDYVAEATGRLQAQASDFAGDMKERAGRAYEAAADQVADVAAAAKERVGQAVHVGAEQMTEVAGATKQRVQDWGSQATAAVREASTQVKEQTASVAREATDQADELRRSVVRAAENVVAPKIDAISKAVQNAGQDRETRDSLLLGAASVAVIAALGIACQRKLHETAETNR